MDPHFPPVQQLNLPQRAHVVCVTDWKSPVSPTAAECCQGNGWVLDVAEAVREVSVFTVPQVDSPTFALEVQEAEWQVSSDNS